MDSATIVITSEEMAKQHDKSLDRAVKTVPKDYDLFDYDIIEFIYAGKIAFLDHNTQTAVILENPIIAEFQKKLFKLLYSKL